MSFSDYLHGIEVDERQDGAPAVTSVRTSVIGIIGTALSGELDTPYLIKKASENLMWGGLDSDPKKSTLVRALEAIQLQTNPLIVAINAKEGAIAGSAADQTGVYALLKAQSKVGYTPKILIAPGFSHDPNVRAALLDVAKKLRATVIMDQAADAKTSGVLTDAANFSSSRLYGLHPWVEGVGSIGDMPLSPFVAGLIARNDAENGFWSSPSNKEIFGIKALKQDIAWSLSDPNCEANLLNEKGIATVIRHGGFRLWGARTLGKTDKADIANKFLNVRRITDAINDSIAISSLWAVDQGIVKNYIQDVLESVSNYLRNLKSKGAIVNGTAWVDPEENTPDQIKEGKVIFSFDYSPSYPSEQVKFKSILTDKYLKEIFE